MTSRPSQHGERACYLRGCRRPECADAHYRYMSRYRLDLQRGQRRRVPAAPARARVHALLDAGWSRSQIATTTGCSARGVSALARGHVNDVSPLTERRILALPVGPPPTPPYVDATGTMRRLQALVAIGHPMVNIAAAIGTHHSALSRIANGELDQIRSSTANTTARVYRQLALTAGTSARARNHAARRGWHGPMAWDEHTIDEPAAQPETDTSEPQPAGAIERGQIAAEEVRHLARFGVSAHEIARRVGRSPSYVRSILTGTRAPGWRQQLDTAA